MIDARGNTVTHGFILVRAAGPYVLGIVLGLAEIAPASWRLQRAAWSLLWGYRPPGVAWRRSEGPSGQGLVLVEAGAASEGRAHAV